MSFSGIAGRIILSLFQNSYKGWKGKFSRVCCAKQDPTALDGFPLYWTEHPKLLKPKTLDELSFVDRGVCEALAGLGIVFDTPKLIACEYNAHTLSTYFGREARFLLPFLICVLLHHACSVGLLHLFPLLLSVHLYSLYFIYLHAVWIYITALAVGLAFCDLYVTNALCLVWCGCNSCSLPECRISDGFI